MKRIILAVAAALAADAAFGATPMVSEKATEKRVEYSVTAKKKKRSFRSFLAKSAGFVAESAIHGGTLDK